jgi:putative hydrolase of the HAD superfamily
MLTPAVKILYGSDSEPAKSSPQVITERASIHWTQPDSLGEDGSRGLTDLRNSSNIKAVILDYGMVLCNPPTAEEMGRMVATFRVEPEQFSQLWGRNRDLYDRGDMSPERYWSLLAQNAGVTLEPGKLEQLCRWDVEMWAHENQAMVEWARQVRSSEIKTAVLSNMHRDMIAYARANFAWLGGFDHLTFSAEVRLIKPDPAIYEHSLRGVGVQPAEALFVDDRETNVQAARALGMHAIRFESESQLKDDLGQLGFSILPLDTNSSRPRIAAPSRNG